MALYMAVYRVLDPVSWYWDLYPGSWDPVFRVPPRVLYQTNPIFRYPVPIIQLSSTSTTQWVLVLGGARRVPTRPYLPGLPGYGPIWLNMAHMALYGP